MKKKSIVTQELVGESTDASKERKTRRPPKTFEGLEAEIALEAMNLAREQIRNGTVSSQVHAHFLKAASSMTRLEKKKITAEVALLEQKKTSLIKSDENAALYSSAIEALKRYGGAVPSNLSTGSNDDDT